MDEQRNPERKSYVADYGRPLESPKEAAAIAAPMILLALAVGFLVGAAVWLALGVANLATRLIWHDLSSLVDVVWYPLAVCTLGGVVIGVWTKATGNTPAPLDEVMATVKRTGGYRLDGVGKSVVSFILPLAFGGSVGPEAGLTGIIAGACTWIGDRLRRAGLMAKSVADLSVSAVLSAVFGSPFFGLVAAAEDALPDESSYSFRRSAKIVLYTASAIGALAGAMCIASIPGLGGGLPHFDPIAAEGVALLATVPLAICGWALSLVFHASSTVARTTVRRVPNATLVAPIVCGVLIGAVAMFLPDVLFAGEEQSAELALEWTAIPAAVLLLTGVLKLAITPLCLNFGWHGGNFFPCIFAGISFGYGASALTGADPMLCVTCVTTSLISAITRRPLLALGLLLLCFPAQGILWSGIAAFIGACIPIPAAILASDKHAAARDAAEPSETSQAETAGDGDRMASIAHEREARS